MRKYHTSKGYNLDNGEVFYLVCSNNGGEPYCHCWEKEHAENICKMLNLFDDICEASNTLVAVCDHYTSDKDVSEARSAVIALIYNRQTKDI